MKKRIGNITAFTLFEVMIVLAIMGVLITIISLSLNRFNEQLKVSSELQQELNVWYRFRANLWRELYQADSMRYDNHQLIIFDNQEIVSYKVEEDSLFRKNTVSDWTSTGFSTSSIRHDILGKKGNRYSIDFNWKGEILTLSFLDHESPKDKIDQYFEGF